MNVPASFQSVLLSQSKMMVGMDIRKGILFNSGYGNQMLMVGLMLMLTKIYLPETIVFSGH